MSVELHLPDLPEVAIALGASAEAAPPVRPPWHLRLRDAVSAYLPLLVMALLALASWWLVKNSPRPPGDVDERPLSGDPDYTMTHFALDRFDAAGRLKLRLEGDVMRHYPSTDRTEIDGVRIRAVAADGRVTLAHARRALANGDGSQVQLTGGAEVTSVDAAGAPLVMRSDFLHLFLVTERVRTPVQVTVQSAAGGEVRAAGLEYDNATQRLDLKGPMRATLPARGVPAQRASRGPAAQAALPAPAMPVTPPPTRSTTPSTSAGARP